MKRSIHKQFTKAMLFFAVAAGIYLVRVGMAIYTYDWFVVTLPSNQWIAITAVLGGLAIASGSVTIINEKVNAKETIPGHMLLGFVFWLCVRGSASRSRAYDIMTDEFVVIITLLIFAFLVMNAHSLIHGWRWNRKVQEKIDGIKSATLASIPERVSISVSDDHDIKIKYTRDPQCPTHDAAIETLEAMKI